MCRSPVHETVQVLVTPRGGGRWVRALHELAAQNDAGHVYDRDLPPLADAPR